jgi:hypothetical protein
LAEEKVIEQCPALLLRETRMPISVVCDCGKEFKVKDETAGKKVRCPACQTVLTVPAAEEEEAPRPKPGKKAAAFEDLDDGNEVVSRKGGKKKGSSKTMLFVLLGGGVLLLSCCCLGGGIGSYFLFFKGGPEKTMIGKWTLDIDAMKKNPPKEMKGMPDEVLAKMWEAMGGVAVEIKSDNTLSMTMPDFGKGDSKTTYTAKWKHVSTKDNIVTLEITFDKTPPPGSKKTETGKLKVIDKDHIQLLSDETGRPDFFMKRA